MLVTISTTHEPATDLGFLLFKHPERAQTFDLNVGEAHVFYPEATEQRCTAALAMDVDAVDLTRNDRYLGESAQHYVNDRPYTANSFTSVALGRVFHTAMSGRSEDRPELAETEIPLEIRLPAVGVEGSDDLVDRLFEPLGWTTNWSPVELDPDHPDWSTGAILDVTLRAEKRLQDALSELYVLLPVLDNEKHYWVEDTEIEKLARHGGSWVPDHPERERILRRYLRWQWELVDQARDTLDVPTPKRDDDGEATPTLHEKRLDRVTDIVCAENVDSIADLGCGEGRLLERLIQNWQFERVIGMDVSARMLERASNHLKLERRPPHIRESVDLVHGSLLYRDDRLEGLDAAVLIEVIEHVEPGRLDMLERVVFGEAHPRLVVVTTPNREYNRRYESLDDGGLRHDDHRFEWERAEFEAWAESTAQRYGYTVRYELVGEVDPEVGAPSQMALFRRNVHSSAEG